MDRGRSICRIKINTAAFALDPTLNDKEVNAFKPGYVLISLLITAVGCNSVQLKEFIGIRLLVTQSTTNRCNDRLSTHLIEQTVRQLMERTKQLTKKQSRRFTPRTKGNSFSTTIAHDIEGDESATGTMRCALYNTTNLCRNAPNSTPYHHIRLHIK